MIYALISIGKACADEYPNPLVEIPYTSWKKGKEPKVLVVDLLTDSSGSLIPKGVVLADYSLEDAKKKYLFRDPKRAQGPAASLSFKLPGKPRALRQRLGILKILGYSADIEDIASFIEKEMEGFKTSGMLAKGVQVLVVLKIDGKWPFENERFENSFESEFFKRLGLYEKKPVWEVDSICHGCGKETKVYGGVGNLLKFYTVDKHGYAPELNPELSWKQYALCRDCILNLERGRRAVDDFLTYSFYGKDFWLLPVAAFGLEEVLEGFRCFRGKVYKEEFVNLEDELLYEASLKQNVILYHFVFTAKEQQALRILLHIEEVLPSLLSKYVETKRNTEEKFNLFLSEFLDERYRFSFFTSHLKATSKKPGFTDKDFFEIVDAVFRKAPLDEKLILSKVMDRVRADIAEQGDKFLLPRRGILEAFISLLFLKRWGVVNTSGGIDMHQRSGNFAEFFETFEDFFDHPAKKALVLLGVLIQKFLNYQFTQRGSTPFAKHLKNLRLSQKDVQNLFVSLQNKMMEYEVAHKWQDLKAAIASELVEAGSKWKLSPDEIGFYIVVGMALHKHPVFGREIGQEG